MYNQIINSSTNPNAAADTPQPQTPLTPDVAIGQIRSLRAQLPAVGTLTSKQRRALRSHAVNAEPIVQASVNVIGVSDVVSSAIGQPLDAVRALQQEAVLWKAVEEEARNLVAGLAGANLLRRQKLAVLGAQAYAIGSQVAKVPENEVLVSHVEEIKRMKRVARRKKPATPAPQPPSPTPSTPSAPTTGASHAESKS
jgi:RNA-binding protein YhbY